MKKAKTIKKYFDDLVNGAIKIPYGTSSTQHFYDYFRDTGKNLENTNYEKRLNDATRRERMKDVQDIK